MTTSGWDDYLAPDGDSTTLSSTQPSAAATIPPGTDWSAAPRLSEADPGAAPGFSGADWSDWNAATGDRWVDDSRTMTADPRVAASDAETSTT